MVDFNSEQLFTANKGEILNIIILGRRDELLNTFQLWREKVLIGAGSSMEYKLRSCLFTLFLEVAEPIERKLEDTKELKHLLAVIYSNDTSIPEEDLLTAFRTINGFLDDLNLIRIDNKKKYDTTDIEAENEEKGL